MGETEAKQSAFFPTVLGSIKSGETTSEDTQHAAKEMMNLGVDLLFFAGGDGTAGDIYNAVGQQVTVLGIPAGVKIHSGVYAVTPRHAGEVAVKFLTTATPETTEAEVMDIDERTKSEWADFLILYRFMLQNRIDEAIFSIGFLKS